MNINATLFGQMITFGILVWVTMQYIWPPIIAAMEKRQKEIADGLDAAKAGQDTLAGAKKERTQIISKAHTEAQNMVKTAEKKVTTLLNAAKQEQYRMQQAHEKKLTQQNVLIKQQLLQDARDDITDLALLIAEKLVGQSLDSAANKALLKRLLEQLPHAES